MEIFTLHVQEDIMLFARRISYASNTRASKLARSETICIMSARSWSISMPVIFSATLNAFIEGCLTRGASLRPLGTISRRCTGCAHPFPSEKAYSRRSLAALAVRQAVAPARSDPQVLPIGTSEGQALSACQGVAQRTLVVPVGSLALERAAVVSSASCLRHPDHLCRQLLLDLCLGMVALHHGAFVVG